MKKLFNSRFLFILASSIVVLIILTVGAFYLFDENDDVFIKSGYVLNPLSANSEKYFFDENVGYRENLSSMIEFVDVDENTVSVLKDSFVHYMDDSLSFLKNGAILDMDSIKGSKVVSFYNITNESIIEKDSSGYVIESANGEIRLNNFIGRISDNKYIVVGDLSLKMAGNSTSIKGEYFEVVYVEEGIVNIENKDVKYQVTAEDTFIYVGNDKVIDLGDKKIVQNGEDVMSITAITIDGNENIEIIPKGNEDDDTTGEDGDDEEDDNNQVDNNQPGNTDNGTGDNVGGTGNDKVDSEPIEEVTISLKDAKIGSTNIDVIFDVINAEEDDNFKLQVVNLSSGRTVDIVAQVLTDVEIKVNLLTPNTKYLFMVVNEKDNAKYFQKVFETTGFGIKLEKTYATDSSLSYKVIIEEGTDITNAKLSLYKFNEDTMENEIVKSCYQGAEPESVICEEKITYLSSFGDNIEGEHEIVFDGLDSDTIYTAVLDEFSLASSNFKDIYNVTLTSMTLKKIPSFSEMTVEKDAGSGSFNLSLGNITDPDNAIVSYTYMIYDRLTDVMAIEPIVHTNASPINVKIGDDENQLKNDTNYYYKVVIEYYDNEKYIEYITTDSITFIMGNDPYITVVPNEKLITYEQIGATIYLKDNSCLISMPGRDKCSGESSTVVEVSRVNAVTGERKPVFTKLVEFDVDNELGEIKYDLLVDNLQPGTTYSIEVKANYNNGDGLDKQDILHTDESRRTIATKSLTQFDAKWTKGESSAAHVVNVGVQFEADEDTGTLSGDESAAAIEKVVLKLYEGKGGSNLQNSIPLSMKTYTNTAGFNIKEKFYDDGFSITSDGTFGLDIEALKSRSTGGKLNEYYTVVVEAYYDEEQENKVDLDGEFYPYPVSRVLLMGEIEEPVLEVDNISNSMSGNYFSNLVNDGSIVGYKLSAAFDRTQLIANGIVPKKINFYVYNLDGERVNFYYKDADGNIVMSSDKIYTADLGENNYYELNVYMDYGIEYGLTDDIMRRGDDYYVGYEVVVEHEGGTDLYPTGVNADAPSAHGLYERVFVEKESPTLKMYIASSTENSITYVYNVKDPDKALYKEDDSEDYGFYVRINNDAEVKYNIEKTDETLYNEFDGRITINGLKSGDLYSLYYKKHILNSGSVESDIANYLNGHFNDVRMFDGYYNAKENIAKYNFSYKIINNPLKDNRVVIKILANEDILKRILSYKITFEDSRGNIINKELWKLNTCDGDDVDDTPRCLAIDYIDLKSMKSNMDETNTIKVKVNAVYDNGLTGYDFKVGSGSDAEYLYMIMQDNSTSEGMGPYISFTSSGQQVTAWSETLGAPKGYYTYSYVGSTMIYYKSQLNSSHTLNIKYSLSSTGYTSNVGTLNPKMVSVDEMKCSGGNSTCNTFSFSSITPKVSVKERTSIINGSINNFTLSGIDVGDLVLDDNNYYLYVEVWDNSNDAGDLSKVVRPTLKVKIDKENPTNTISATIDGLKENTTYYFNVYANMYKEGNKLYTQLFDSGITDRYQTKTYSLKTLTPSSIFHSIDTNFTSSEEIYGNREMNTKINLVAYKNSTPFNFDVVYLLCEIPTSGSVGGCDPDNKDSYIFKSDIPIADISTSILNSVDISEYDIDYNKEYYLQVYARADYYESADSDSLVKRNILLNLYKRNVKLRKLNEPSFTATRNAILINGDYGFDLTINVNDADRTFINGNYYIKVLNQAGEIVGNMQLLDSNGDYYDVSNYHEYAFDAFVLNKQIRILGLEKDTRYTLFVYGDAYLNNIGEENPDAVIPPDASLEEIKKAQYTFEIKKQYTVYTTNDYGVAFGNDITYSATEKSIIVTFVGGSNFENVVEVGYTVGLWDSIEDISTLGGTFIIGENNKRFEIYQNSDDWRFVIDPAGMTNILGKTYEVTISFKVRVPGTNNYIVLTHEEVSGFRGKAIYVEDE